VRTTLYLIRHGETDWNLNGIWQGHADVPLNAVGRAQARRLAQRLRAEGPRFDVIYSSDLQRAWETAGALAAAIGISSRPEPALREIDVGAWSGRTNAQIMAEDAEIYERIRSGEDVARGGGERFLDLYGRVIGAVERIVAAHPGATLALVSHGGPVRALLLHAARDKVGLTHRPQRVHIGNTSITVLSCDSDGWEIEAVSDMAHLEASADAHDMMSAPPDDAERP
jgi:broad specificity phosphatase PhoE